MSTHVMDNSLGKSTPAPYKNEPFQQDARAPDSEIEDDFDDETHRCLDQETLKKRELETILANMSPKLAMYEQNLLTVLCKIGLSESDHMSITRVLDVVGAAKIDMVKKDYPWLLPELHDAARSRKFRRIRSLKIFRKPPSSNSPHETTSEVLKTINNTSAASDEKYEDKSKEQDMSEDSSSSESSPEEEESDDDDDESEDDDDESEDDDNE